MLSKLSSFFRRSTVVTTPDMSAKPSAPKGAVSKEIDLTLGDVGGEAAASSSAAKSGRTRSEPKKDFSERATPAAPFLSTSVFSASATEALPVASTISPTISTPLEIAGMSVENGNAQKPGTVEVERMEESMKAEQPKPVRSVRKVKPETAIIELDADLVARRAFEIWHEEGCPDDRHEANWLQAEAELRAKHAV